MKNRLAVFTVALLGLMVAACLQPLMAQDNSPTNPAAVKRPLKSMVELGSVYTNIYDITITVLETVRGNAAMEQLKAAGPNVKAPAAGFEYVLARIKLTGSDLTEYDRVSLTVPKPALAGLVKPGGSMEGWVGFAVAQKDSKPVMVFDPDTGGATGRGKTLFFKLY
jgi:hypothetical protein